MNIFREVRRRRSSSAAGKSDKKGKEEKLADSSVAINPAKGHASLRRSLLRRSRTASHDLNGILCGSRGDENGNTDAAANPRPSSSFVPSVPTVTLSASATSTAISRITDWSYCRPPQAPQPPSAANPPRPSPPRRSASLGRPPRRSATAGDIKCLSTFRVANNSSSHRDRGRAGRRPRSVDFNKGDSLLLGGLPVSNGQFLRAVQERLIAIEDAAARGDFSSLESLLEEGGEGGDFLSVLAASANSDASNLTSLEQLDEADEEADEEDSGSSVSMPSSSRGRKRPAARSSSLPRTVLGSIQLKVREIREQLEVLKADRSRLVPPGSSQETGDSSSPCSLSPAVASIFPRPSAVPPPLQLAEANSSSPSTLSPCSSNSLVSSASAAQPQQLLPAQPKLMRPRVLKLPQSHSFNNFGQEMKSDENAKERRLGSGSFTPAPGSQRDRLIFFFDIINTQEKIAKVKALDFSLPHSPLWTVP